MIGGHRPKPVKNQFSRPSVSLDKQARSWQEVDPLQLAVGDIVPDFGKIESVLSVDRQVAFVEGARVDVITVEIMFLSGDVHDFPSTERIKAFTTGESPWGDLPWP